MQIEFKDLNRSPSAESFLEDLTDEAVNIVGGTIEGAILASTGANITLARAEEYRTFILNTLDNLQGAENFGTNFNVVYTTTRSNPAHGCVVFKLFSTSV